jgi:hypothetical protein
MWSVSQRSAKIIFGLNFKLKYGMLLLGVVCDTPWETSLNENMDMEVVSLFFYLTVHRFVKKQAPIYR